MGLGATAIGASLGADAAPAEPWSGAAHGAARGLGSAAGAVGGGLLGLLGAHAAGVEGPRAIAAATGAGGLLGGIGGYGATARILGDGPFARHRAWRDEALAAMEDGDDDDAYVASERRYLPGATSTIADVGDGLRVEGPFPEDSGGAAPRGDSARRNLYLLTGGEAGDVLGYLNYIAAKSGTMVENLTTLPPARNKGHARRLMDHFVARHGGTPIFLDAALRDESVDPERLGRFYSRLGFAHKGDGLWIRPASRGEKSAAVTVGRGSPVESAIAGTAGRLNPNAFLTGLLVAPDEPLASLVNPRQEGVEREAGAYQDLYRDPADLAVRVGGTDVIDDLRRVWKNPRTTIVGKAFGTATTPMQALWSNLSRSTSYNPYSHSIVTYSRLPEAARHELGHAADFGRFQRNSKKPDAPGGGLLARMLHDAYAMGRAAPVIATLGSTAARSVGEEGAARALDKAIAPLAMGAIPLALWQEFAASREASRMTDAAGGSAADKDRAQRRLWRRLAPALGTYVGGIGGRLIPNPTAGSRAVSMLAGVLGGHAVAAARNAMTPRPDDAPAGEDSRRRPGVLSPA